MFWLPALGFIEQTAPFRWQPQTLRVLSDYHPIAVVDLIQCATHHQNLMPSVGGDHHAIVEGAKAETFGLKDQVVLCILKINNNVPPGRV